MRSTPANALGGDLPRSGRYSPASQRSPTVRGESWVNSPDQVFVARNGEAEPTRTMLTAGQVRDLVEQMPKVSGRRLDLSRPEM